MEKNVILEINHCISEVELVYKSKMKASLRPIISSSSEAYHIFLGSWEDGKIELLEQFKALFLNRANKVLALLNLSLGGLTGTVADPRLVFIAALRLHACAVILCHNHPSGNIKPSRTDEEMTQKCKQAGQFLDIKVLDHLIITEESYFSFADEGLL